MDAERIVTLSGGILGILSAVYVIYTGLKRLPSQNAVDDSQAAINYRNVTVTLQAEIKDLRAENKEIKAMLEKARLQIIIEMGIGGVPVIKDFTWKEQEAITVQTRKLT